VIKPRRVSDLRIEPFEDAFMVYLNGRDRVHYLNHTAVLVLELSTGENDGAQMATIIQGLYQLDSPPTREVQDIVANMIDEGLVEANPQLDQS